MIFARGKLRPEVRTTAGRLQSAASWIDRRKRNAVTRPDTGAIASRSRHVFCNCKKHRLVSNLAFERCNPVPVLRLCSFGCKWNSQSPRGVLYSRVSSRKTCIHIVAVVALFVGLYPTGAIASMFATKCKMTGCGDPAHQRADPICFEGCESTGLSSNGFASVQERPSDRCNCNITSGPTTSQSAVAIVSASGLSLEHIVAGVPFGRTLGPCFSQSEFRPVFFGSDPSPPASRFERVSLGRAPPCVRRVAPERLAASGIRPRPSPNQAQENPILGMILAFAAVAPRQGWAGTSPNWVHLRLSNHSKCE